MGAGWNKELNEHEQLAMLHLMTQNLALNHALCTASLSDDSQMLLEPLTKRFALCVSGYRPINILQ